MEKRIVIGTHADAARDDREFWFAQTPADRIRHVLELRKLNYGPNANSGSVDRSIAITNRFSLEPSRELRKENRED